MKDKKDITLEDFVFKDEPETIERNYITRQILDRSYDFDLDYFLKDKKFLEEFDEIFADYNANLQGKKAREKTQYIFETLCNPERGYILKTLIYKHTFNLLIQNMKNFVSKEWKERFNQTFQKINDKTRPKQIENLDIFKDNEACGICLVTALVEKDAIPFLKDILSQNPNQKTLCLNISPYELDLEENIKNITEINEFMGSEKIINEIRNFGKENNAKYVIINNYHLLQSQERWFHYNLLDLAHKYHLQIIILASIPTTEEYPLPRISYIKERFQLAYNLSNKIYYVLPVRENTLNKENENGEYEVYECNET